MTRQIEFGVGETWGELLAGEAITSGLVVAMSGDGTIKIGQCSDNILGINLIPASSGRPVSLQMEGVVKLLVTGAAANAGQYVGASNGNLEGRSYVVKTIHTVGIALEDIAIGSRGKIKLTL